jgi:hypothetical protein
MEMAITLIALWCGGYKTEHRIQACRERMIECLLLGKLATPVEKDKPAPVPPTQLEGLRCFQKERLAEAAEECSCKDKKDKSQD